MYSKLVVGTDGSDTAKKAVREAGELAAATGAEAGYVTSGAAAGLTLAAAACLAGLDVAAMDRLPDATGLRDEIVV